MIHNDLYRPSEYRGAPSQAIDDAWDKLWMVPLRIDDQDLGRLHLTSHKNWSRIPDEMGGGFRGYPIVFHQLHCLNTLRKASYREHYQNDKLFKDPPSVSRAHQDHCIEMIRQQLMCSAEMVPTLTFESDGHTLPDFNAVQVCRNFDRLKAWTEANVIHGGGNWDLPANIAEA
ncbi:hypothetical protein EJ03DRAFT_268812 [Teratosphaeria nubilosa]|uniref:Tat pathway signal sequence n=1 Tax=Teratosphaeria nubilosa TaxID=161662 RepID=A0A6G1LE02_9PEZI|nr:hypothetical protein EJ03DRAFT_268812 [Teratosphaeria nubilosa]